MYIQDETLLPFNPSFTWPSLLLVHLGRLVERNKWCCWPYSRAFWREYGLDCFPRLVWQCDRTKSADITQSAITLKPLRGEAINIYYLSGNFLAAGERLDHEADVRSRENVQHEDLRDLNKLMVDDWIKVSPKQQEFCCCYQKYLRLDNQGTRDRDMDIERSLITVWGW